MNARCEMFSDVERTIVSELQLLFHGNKDLVHLFKTAIDLMPTDTRKIVVSADKTPTGEHVRRYNVPTIDEVAIVMVGDQFLPRDIILYKRNAQLVRIAELIDAKITYNILSVFGMEPTTITLIKN